MTTPSSPWNPRGVEAMENSTPPIDTRALGNHLGGASPSYILTTSPISRAQVEFSNCSATRAISMDGPPSGSFNRMNANDNRRIPTSASSRARAIPDDSPPVERSSLFKQPGTVAISSAGDSSGSIVSPRPLESEPSGQLNLTPRADRTEYSAYVVGESPGCIFEDGVSVPSQRKRTLRVTRDREIRMIEQIVGFRSKHDLRALLQWEALLQRHIELGERGATQDITPGIAKPA